jgi:hypothetical protein
MPAAEQMGYVHDLFTSFEYWRLRPAPALIADQPGAASPARFIAAAASAERDLIVVYTPEGGSIRLSSGGVPPGRAIWFNPRTGARTDARSAGAAGVLAFDTPGPGDWVLLLTR